MLSVAEVQSLVHRVSYQSGWEIRVGEFGGWPTIQVQAPAAPSWGRLWRVEGRHDESDVSRTLWLAIKTHESHERRELFLVDGKPLWDPHAPVI